MRWTLRTAGAALTILLAGCGSGHDNAPGGATAQEAQALNDAAAMLDDNGQDAVVENSELGNETADAAPGNVQ